MRIAGKTLFVFLMLLLTIPSLPDEGYGAQAIKDLPIDYILNKKEKHYKNSNEEIDKYMFVRLAEKKVEEIVNDLKQKLKRKVIRADLEWEIKRRYGYWWKEKENDKKIYYRAEERKIVLEHYKDTWKKRTLGETEKDPRWKNLWSRHTRVKNHIKASLREEAGGPSPPPSAQPQTPAVRIPDLSGIWCSGSFYRLQIKKHGEGFKVAFFDKNSANQLQGECEAKVVSPSTSQNPFKDEAKDKYVLKGTLIWKHWKGMDKNEPAPIGWNFGIWELDPGKRLNFLRSPGKGGFTHDLSLRTWDVDTEKSARWNGHLFQKEGLGGGRCPEPDWKESIQW